MVWKGLAHKKGELMNESHNVLLYFIFLFILSSINLLLLLLCIHSYAKKKKKCLFKHPSLIYSDRYGNIFANVDILVCWYISRNIQSSLKLNCFTSRLKVKILNTIKFVIVVKYIVRKLAEINLNLKDNLRKRLIISGADGMAKRKEKRDVNFLRCS